MPAADDLDQYIGQIVPSSFNAGVIALSYVVSLIGAGSTLELIHRRTSHKGNYNHLLLVGAAISMGGVAIWSMHYIGNMAINILNGEPELQIAYAPALTTTSFFLPISVLLAAFFAVSIHGEIKWSRIILSGSLSGGAICGMHYLSNESISNYRCSYATANVVGAAVIAVTASTTALALFFVFRAAWTSSWWRRVGCANVLALAVSGMHWCASVGTSYTLLGLHPSNSMSQATTIAVIVCMAAGACFIMAGSAIYSARIKQRYASKAQQIVLAAAVFDGRGRILVNPEGLLPSEKVTDTFPQKSDNDIFDTAHPIFHWMFRASRNWPSVTNLIAGMANHLASLPQVGRNRMGIKLINENGQLIENYDTIFRELFCLAAAALAAQMKESLLGVGVLWDEIFATGTSVWPAAPAQMDFIDVDNTERSFLQKITATKKARDLRDLTEKGQRLQEYGRGSLMFLVRHVDNIRDIDKLEAAGYRFAELHQVAGIIGSRMQVKTPALERRLREMSIPKEDKMMLSPGVHLGVFGVRARVNSHGFDVLVRKDARSRLPTIELPLEQLEQWHVDFLRRLGRLSILTLLQRLDGMMSHSPDEAQFASEFRKAILKLRAQMDFPALDDAILASKVIQVPCSPSGGNPRPASCSLVIMRLVFPIHTNVDNPNFEFIPLLLFKTQQLVYKNSPHHAAFSRSVHREISPLLDSLPAKLPESPTPFSTHGKLSTYLRELRIVSILRRLSWPKTPRHSTADTPCSPTSESRTRLKTMASNCSASSIKPFNKSSLERGRGSPSIDSESAFEKPIAAQVERQRLPHLSSGIMVSQEITVDIQEATVKEDLNTGSSNLGHSTIGPRRKSQPGTGNDEPHIGAGNHTSGSNKDDIAGVSTGMSNVEIGTENEARTFVDELLILCIE